MKFRIATVSLPAACALLWLQSALAPCALATPVAADVPAAGDAALARLADDYFDQYYFPQNPTAATTAGIHRYDDQLEDYSRAGVERQIAALHAYQQRLENLAASGLSERVQGDRELLLSSIRGSLLELEVIRPWQNNPDTYSSGISNSAFTIMERSFAPPSERLRLLIEREQRMPAALEAAHANLRNPPEIYTKIAIEQLPGIISFFQSDLPQAFTAADDQDVQARFAAVNGQVIAALKSYQHWLQTQVLPRSHGDFRLGAKTFQRQAAVRRDGRHAAGSAAADRQRRSQAQSGAVHPRRARTRARQERAAGARRTGADHPEPRALLDSFRATFDGLISFINERHIITIPSQRAADPARDAAVHARDHLCLDGHTGTVRERGARKPTST
jgi:hypothetical protein